MSDIFKKNTDDGLRRGESLFKKVLRDRLVVENSDEDLAEYYEKSEKTSPGLERGKKIFSNAGSEISREQDSNFRSHAQSCSQCQQANQLKELDFESLCPSGKKIVSNSEGKSYMPNGCSGPNGCGAKNTKKDLTSSDGEAGSSHLSNADQKCAGCGSKATKAISPLQKCKGCGEGFCSDCLEDSKCGQCRMRKNREGKNEDGFRGAEIGLDNSPKIKCEACSKRGHDPVRDWEDCTWGECECPCQSGEIANSTLKNDVFELEKAKSEVQEKTTLQINNETAHTWASRSVACYQLAQEATDEQSRDRLINRANDFKHEALEHAALIEDGGKLVGEIADLCNKFDPTPAEERVNADVEKETIALNPDQEYPHDVIPNSMENSGLKKGVSKYGSESVK